MRRLLIVAAITLVGFAAGVGAGVIYERHRPLPPPPVPFGSEFGRGPRGGFRRGGGPPGGPINRKELIARIEALKPQLDAFQHRMDDITAQFDRDLDPVLTPEQRTKHAEDIKRRRAIRGGGADPARPISDDEISRIMREQTEWSVVGDVVIPMRLDRLTRIYKFDDVQREKVRAMLLTRRTQFLELIDSSPPPTVALSRLAQMVERLKAAPPPEERLKAPGRPPM